MIKRVLGACLSLNLVFLLPIQLWSANVVAVVGAKGGAYDDAVRGLRSVFNDVQVVVVPDQPDLKGAKVVVTFGAAAAAQTYRGNAAIVATMLADPGFEIEHKGALTKVGFPPDPSLLATKIKAMDPKVLVLAVFDPKGAYNSYFQSLKVSAGQAGFTLQIKKVSSLAGLVSQLPGLKGKVQALYVPADPLLMNSNVFVVLTQHGVLSGFGNAFGGNPVDGDDLGWYDNGQL